MSTLRSLAALAAAASVGFGLHPGTVGSAGNPDVPEILDHLSLVYLDDGQGGLVKTIRFTGVNVQIVNGRGSTGLTNGLGNLIVGYNESGAFSNRTGSHCVVGGKFNDYSGYGGIVFGAHNEVTTAHACTLGGLSNRNSGLGSVLLGGTSNDIVVSSSYSVGVAGYNNQILYSDYAAAVGGDTCTVFGSEAVTVGGTGSLAGRGGSTVIGGSNNVATGFFASVTGGRDNLASGDYSSVDGGRRNVAGGQSSVVGGGRDRTAPGLVDWAAGSLFEDD
jgi:hypothetical protein